MTLMLTYLFGALAISFLCSIMEAVLLSTPMSFITMKEEQGVKTASLMKAYKNNIDRPVSAILSLNTIAHTIGAAGVGAEAVKIWGQEYFGFISAILTLLILIFSEIIPKTIGSTYWRTMSMPATKIIQGMVIITYPLVIALEYITKWISPKVQPLTVSREEVSAMVTVGTEEGVFEAEENKMIQSFIKIVNVTAKEIMTPNLVVEAAQQDSTLREFYDNRKEWDYSRIPIYDDNRDYITGYVLRATVLERLAEDKFNITLKEIKRPILSFMENVSVSDIWEKMLEKKEHISVITDEYGCMRGLVTMEDVIETMLGVEIVDENDDTADLQVLAREKWQRLRKQQGIAN